MKDYTYVRKWQLAAKLLTGQLNPEEQTEWEGYQQDSEFWADFLRVKSYWEQFGALPYQQIDVEKDWQQVWAKAQSSPQKKPNYPFRKLWRYAAVVALAMLATWWTVYLNSTKRTSPIVIQAPAGAKSFVVLPDSSKIWLNAGSKISFDNQFGTDNRDLVLEGEAFFDVIKNKLPFRVHTPQYDIAVLGTAFNVRAYRDDDRTITTLVRGSLKVLGLPPASGQEEVLLKPREKLILWRQEEPASAMVQIEQGVNTEAATDWKDGWLSVQGESLEELAKKIARVYDVDLQFRDEALKEYRYTGRIRQLSLEQVLKALSLTSPVNYTIRERTVILSENQSAKSKYRSLQKPAE